MIDCISYKYVFGPHNFKPLQFQCGTSDIVAMLAGNKGYCKIHIVTHFTYKGSTALCVLSSNIM